MENQSKKLNKKLLMIIGGSVAAVAVLAVVLVLALGGKGDKGDKGGNDGSSDVCTHKWTEVSHVLGATCTDAGFTDRKSVV